VSKDINARVKAVSIGLKAVDYEKQKVNFERLYTGYSEADVSCESWQNLQLNGVLAWNDGLIPNQYLLLRCRDQAEARLARYDSAAKSVVYLPGGKEEKLSHWMQPLFDNLEYILSVYKKPQFKSVDQLMSSKHIELEVLAAEPVHHHRRGPESFAARNQDHRQPRRHGYQGRAHRRPLPDRQPLP
jgi:predicted ribonuclease YlaK